MDDAVIKKDIDTMIQQVLKNLKGVVAIYLFGSIVKGSQNEYSDYDIAVIVNRYPKNDIDVITNIRYSLIDVIKRPLDIVILDIKDLEVSSPLLYEIYHDNELIFGFNILKESEVVNQNIQRMKPITIDGVVVGYHV